VTKSNTNQIQKDTLSTTNKVENDCMKPSDGALKISFKRIKH
jgi:hypothetical protein